MYLATDNKITQTAAKWTHKNIGMRLKLRRAGMPIQLNPSRWIHGCFTVQELSNLLQLSIAPIGSAMYSILLTSRWLKSNADSRWSRTQKAKKRIWLKKKETIFSVYNAKYYWQNKFWNFISSWNVFSTYLRRLYHRFDVRAF